MPTCSLRQAYFFLGFFCAAGVGLGLLAGCCATFILLVFLLEFAFTGTHRLLRCPCHAHDDDLQFGQAPLWQTWQHPSPSWWFAFQTWQSEPLTESRLFSLPDQQRPPFSIITTAKVTPRIDDRRPCIAVFMAPLPSFRIFQTRRALVKHHATKVTPNRSTRMPRRTPCQCGGVAFWAPRLDVLLAEWSRKAAPYVWQRPANHRL